MVLFRNLNLVILLWLYKNKTIYFNESYIYLIRSVYGTIIMSVMCMSYYTITMVYNYGFKMLKLIFVELQKKKKKTFC